MTIWNSLRAVADTVSARRITDLFDTPDRAARFSARFEDMLFDFSKTNIDQDILDQLLDIAAQADVAGRRDAMFAGAKINDTEGRAVLHTALRASSGPVMVDGQDVIPGVHAVLDQMAAFCADVRGGTFKGQGGTITDVVNIGIGGSDLGPAMAYIALQSYADGPRCHFVSNVDGAQIAEVMGGLDLTRTLVIVASKPLPPSKP